MSQPRAKFARILSIDGGGIRGIIPAAVLVTLEAKLQKATGNPNARISDFFDLIAGTSTGGIMTCCLLVPGQDGRPKYSANDVLEIYYKEGARIFDQSLFQHIKTLDGFVGTKYSTKNLRDIIHSHVGDLKLSQLLRPCVVSAFNIQASKSFFFKSHEAVRSPERDFLVEDVALSTSAAPTYFEPHQARTLSGKTYPYIDGGVVCNNPAMCGLVEATKMFNCTQHEAVVLSLGTGSAPKGYTYEQTKDWGPVRWAQPLLEFIVIGGVSQVVDYQIREVYSGPCAAQYLRLQVNLEGTGAVADMDDASSKNRDALKAVGEKLAADHDAELDRFVSLLLSTA